ncbi:MAG: hypothetical protein K2Y21_01055 [Phycisphaerales bacterium]|nr:hypothetical protein [Phycisphaerales bacterium]
MPRFVSLGLGLLVALGSMLNAQAQTYFNTDQLVIPADAASVGGRASVYPSTITVTNGPAKIGDISVTLANIKHWRPKDLYVLLVGPQGQRVYLMSACGGNLAIALTTVTFNQGAARSLPEFTPILTGTYKPTQYEFGQFPSPAPPEPHDISLDVFKGTNANGVWSLYLWDRFNDPAGGEINGWSISFAGQTQTSFTYQGVLQKNGVALSGDANVRFALHGGAVSSVADPPLAGPITKSLSGVDNGVFTTELDVGAAALTPREMWLEIAVESPPGTGYSTIGPRTRLAIVPVAGRALSADTATLATTATTAQTAISAKSATTASTATTVPTAATANAVAWTAVTNVPITVSTLPRVFSFADSSASVVYSVSPTYPDIITHTAQIFDFQEGVAVVHFSMSAYTNSAPSVFEIKCLIAGVTQFTSPPVRFTFNESLEHKTISGKFVLPVPAGRLNFFFLVKRTLGSGDLGFDTGDTITYTIVNYRQ